MKRTNDIGWNKLSLLLLMVAAVLVGACSDGDSDPTSGPDASMSCLQLDGLTRAGESPARSASGYHAATDNGAVMALLMTDPANEDNPNNFYEFGQFEYTSKGWISTLYAKSVGNPTYHLYGFMPAEADESDVADLYKPLKVESVDQDYSEGITLTLHTSPVSFYDVCVITGVQHYTNDDIVDDNPPAVNIQDGTFGFEMTTSKDHYLRVMTDHIYAGVSFTMKVNATYAALRTIKLRELDLKVSGYSPEIDIPVKANNTGADPIGTIGLTKDVNKKQEISFFRGELTLSAEAQTVGVSGNAVWGYFIPDADVVESLKLVSTYDVYDTKGNLVREGCTAENRLNLAVREMTRGQLKTVNLTVSPTYLYVLSEPDLENPISLIDDDE